MSAFGKVQHSIQQRRVCTAGSLGCFDLGGIHVIRPGSDSEIDLSKLKEKHPLKLLFSAETRDDKKTRVKITAGCKLFSGFICDFMTGSFVPVLDKPYLALHDVGSCTFSKSYSINCTAVDNYIYVEAYGDWL